MTPLIREPALEWAAGQAMTVRLDPLTLPVGRVLADFSGWTLKIRLDPAWPRSGATEAARVTADPIADAWAVSVTSAGALATNPLDPTGPQVPTFAFTMPSGAGVKRYSVDVWGALTAGGEVQLVRATWLTAGGRVE